MKQLSGNIGHSVQERIAKAVGAYLVILIMILAVSAGTAWSFDTYDPAEGGAVDQVQGDGANPFASNAPSPAMADSCLPLLKSIHYTAPVSAMDRNQRSAGKAVALGLVFGVRFALTPPAKTGAPALREKARVDIWEADGAFAGNRNALAVSAYRQCQKERALQALSDFRWTR